MKTFLRENKLRLLFLGIPVLFLIALWNANIYKIWYDNTPWVKLRTPPSKITNIYYIYFPQSPEKLPKIGVYAEDKKIYSMDGTGRWDLGHSPDYTIISRISTSAISPDKSVCITVIQNAWGLDDEQDQNADIIYTRASCAFSSFDNNQYVVYKIMPTGDIWMKYVTDDLPGEYRKWASYSLCLFLVLSAPIWMRLFFQSDLLKPEPDYKAN